MNDSGTSGSICAETVPTGGFTYFVRKGDAIKIGFSADPSSRFKGLQGEHGALESLAVVSETVIGEYEAHQKFAHLRTHGEWFRADPELLDFVGQMKLATTMPIRDITRGLRRLRPNYADHSAHSAISKLIGQCDSWENGGNRDALRGAMEASMQTIEANRRMARQGE